MITLSDVRKIVRLYAFTALASAALFLIGAVTWRYPQSVLILVLATAGAIWLMLSIRLPTAARLAALAGLGIWSRRRK